MAMFNSYVKLPEGIQVAIGEIQHETFCHETSLSKSSSASARMALFFFDSPRPLGAVRAAGAHSVDVKMNSKKGTEILKTLTNDIPYTS